MPERQSFAKLREALAYLYEDEAAARRVAYDADLDIGQISFANKAIDNWNNILLQAQKEGKTASLMAVTFKEFRENETLSKAWHDYLITVGKGIENTQVYSPAHSSMRWALGWLGIVVAISTVLGVVFLGSSIIQQFLGFSLVTPTPTVAMAESNSGKSSQQSEPIQTPVALTPKPTTTSRPIPTATIDADPTVYDNFDNPAFDGKLDTSLWAPSVTSPSYIEQRGGALVFSFAPGAGEIASLFSTKYIKSNQYNFAESKIFLSSEKIGQRGEMGFALMTTDKKGQDIIFLCVISRRPPIQTWCEVYGRNEGTEYKTETIMTSYDVWHIVRIEMDPEINATFYIDGEQVGSYKPNDAEEIKGKDFALRLEIFNPNQDGIEAHVDDVRIGQLK